MKLIVHELKDSGVYQELTTSENTIVEAVRPHIYKHLSPSGSLKVQIQGTNGKLISESEEVSISSVSSADYFHGYIKFDVNAHLKKDTTYRIAVVGTSGYSFSESAYIGICNGFDLGKYDADYSPSDGFNAPLDLEIWRRTA